MDKPVWTKWGGRGYHEYEIKRKLGLTESQVRRMPADFRMAPRELDGVRVLILSSADARAYWDNGSGFNHRVIAECPRCERLMSAGRLHQHLGFSSIGRRRVARPCVAEEVQ